jgi:hypothetical protein
MGCFGSKLPPAKRFLVEQTCGAPLMPAPPNLKMNGWSITHGHTAAEDWTLHDDDLQIIDSVATEMRAKPSCGVVLVKGEKPPEQLNIVDEGETLLATLHMPPHLSLGIGATLTDPAGNVMAVMQSSYFGGARPSPEVSSSYCIYSGKPQFAGQWADQLGRYLWATVTRKPLTSNCTVTDGAGADAFKVTFAKRSGSHMSAHKVMMETASGQGVMLVSPTDGKRHSIQCATGGDSILYVCILYATALLDDELVRISRADNDDGGSERGDD